ncbi:MAG: lysylphosphatidylglycerol synthase transmembrane domain-containing protein [Miltoncostaeaceae bacterium]
MSAARASAGRPGAGRRRLIWRIALLGVTAASLYLLLPSLVEVFSSWPALRDLNPWWFALMAGTQAASLACVWTLQRAMLRTRGWFAVATSQLAGNAFGRVVPGGGATAAALQVGMLARSGVPSAQAVSALTTAQAVGFATLAALPVVSLLTFAGSTPIDRGLLAAAWIGAIAFVVLFAVGAVLLITERPLVWLGAVIQAAINRLRRHRELSGLPQRLAQERQRVAQALAARWPEALAASVGRWAFDYATLLAALWAVDADPDPSLVLLAFTLSALLSMIPLTPGGLGFVEAGLTGTLALAGVAGGDAVVAALAYRLFSYWLHLPAGPVAYWLFGRRYGRRGGAEPARG